MFKQACIALACIIFHQKNHMTMKKSLATDWAFVLTTATGMALHAAAHTGNHDCWHDMAVCHVVASAAFTAAVAAHIWFHRRWYRRIMARGADRRALPTAVVTAMFAATALSGLALLGTDGPGTHAGLWHYGAGLAASVAVAGHAARRMGTLIKASGSKRRP